MINVNQKLLEIFQFITGIKQYLGKHMMSKGENGETKIKTSTQGSINS